MCLFFEIPAEINEIHLSQGGLDPEINEFHLSLGLGGPKINEFHLSHPKAQQSRHDFAVKKTKNTFWDTGYECDFQAKKQKKTHSQLLSLYHLESTKYKKYRLRAALRTKMPHASCPKYNKCSLRAALSTQRIVRNTLSTRCATYTPLLSTRCAKQHLPNEHGAKQTLMRASPSPTSATYTLR